MPNPTPVAPRPRCPASPEARRDEERLTILTRADAKELCMMRVLKDAFCQSLRYSHYRLAQSDRHRSHGVQKDARRSAIILVVIRCCTIRPTLSPDPLIEPTDRCSSREIHILPSELHQAYGGLVGIK
jgi:hypothetical protein